MNSRVAVVVALMWSGVAAFAASASLDLVGQQKNSVGNRDVQRGPLGGQRPSIASITPVDPDGFPVVTLGQPFTITGTGFSANTSDDTIAFSRYVEPAPASPQSTLAQLHPDSATAQKLVATASMTLPTVPAQYYVWVRTTKGGWSSPVAVEVEGTPASIPTPQISNVQRQYPMFDARVDGSGFVPGSWAYIKSNDGTPDIRMATRYVNAEQLVVTLPQGLKPPGAEMYIDNLSSSPGLRRSPIRNFTLLEPVPLNLYWLSTDPNGYPLNPYWGYQLTRKPTDPNYCPNPRQVVQTCTQTGSVILTQPTFDETNDWCTVGEWFGLSHGSGHVNWMPVTYMGDLNWSSFSNGTFQDRDYNFYLYPPDGPGSTRSSQGICLEFNFDETVDHYHTPWWDAFHHAVDHDSMMANSMVHLSKAIVTGLFGLDCAHAADSESHPVWAMAVLTDQQYSGDKWAVFARNFGNEGFCSEHVLYVEFPGKQYVLRIPWKPGATGVQIGSTEFWTRDDVPVGVSSRVVQNDGVYFTFDFSGAQITQSADCWGELTLKWSGSTQPYPPKMRLAPVEQTLAGQNTEPMRPREGLRLPAERSQPRKREPERRAEVAEEEDMSAELTFRNWLLTRNGGIAQKFAAGYEEIYKSQPSMEVRATKVVPRQDRTARSGDRAPRPLVPGRAVTAVPDVRKASFDKQLVELAAKLGALTDVQRRQLTAKPKRPAILQGVRPGAPAIRERGVPPGKGR